MNTSKRLRSISVAINFLLPVYLACLILCLSLTSAAGASVFKAKLVNNDMEFAIGQVQLTFPDGRTELLPYCSHIKPLVIGSKVYIFTTKEEDFLWSLTGIVVYDATRGRGKSFPLPEDLKLNPYFAQPSFSPDGSKVAYYFVDGESKHKAEFGFVDMTGKVVIPPRFGWARNFSEGLAAVRLGEYGKYGKGTWGFIDRMGQIVIQPQFLGVSDFSEGLAGVRFLSKQSSLDKAVKRIIPPQADPANKWGFIDQKGKMVIPPQFDKVGKFSEGVAPVTINNKAGFIEKMGFIDKTGKMIIPLQINVAHDFVEGLARVRIDKKDGFIDKKGTIVIPPRFDYAHDFSDGVAWVKAGKKWSIIDKAGRITVPPIKSEYDFHHFSEDLAPVQVGKKWGFIDKKGQFFIPPQYHDGSGFAQGLARVNMEGKWGYGKWGFIDKTGKMVIPAQYDHALSFSAGLAGVLIDGKYGFIDRTGKMIIPPQYDYVRGFSEGLAVVAVGDMEQVLGGVRVRSWPDWHLLWQSSLCPLRATDASPLPPLWETKSQVEFDPEFFDPSRFLSFQVPEGEKRVQ